MSYDFFFRYILWFWVYKSFTSSIKSNPKYFVAQSCLTTVHRILQAGILEWVAFPFSRESFQPRDWTQVSLIAGRFFYQLRLLRRKVMTNLDSILKSRDITLPTKVHLVKTMVFPVVMYGCESWTIKKAGRQRTDAFELWCWRGLLRVPWTARRSNQSILKQISPGCSF